VGAMLVGLGVVVGLQGTGLATPWVLTVGAGAALVVASLGASFTPEARSAQRGNDSEG
jgi:flagellar basal body P-ring protein FlgI